MKPAGRIWILMQLVLVAPSLGCEQDAEPVRKYARSADGYLMVLREGDDVFAQLTRLAVDEQLEGATFTGFGFGHATFGYFDATKKEFDRREFRDVELASLTGSIAWKGDEPSIHVHAVAADRTFSAHGGHLLAFHVGTGSVELQVTRRPALGRQRDEVLGADVLVLPRGRAGR